MDVASVAPLSSPGRGALDDLCRMVFGSSCRFADARVVLRREDYLVVLATLENPLLEIAIKLAGPAAPLACPFDRTAAILRRVREQTDLPVPAPLAQDISYRVVPWRYAITTRLPGIPWSVARQQWRADERASVWGALGRAVAALHSITFPSFGEVGDTGQVLAGQPFPAALAARAERRITNERHRSLFQQLLVERATLFEDCRLPCLSHEDLNPTNLLVRPNPQRGRWELSGLLDFDSAWAGGHEADLARLSLWEGMAGAEFWAGYGLDRDLTLDATERRLILQLLWCLEYAQPTSRHHADTARICAALGIAPIRFA